MLVLEQCQEVECKSLVNFGVPMPIRFRPGTGQLGITGIPTEMIAEFKRLCEGAGRNGRNLSHGEFFEIIFEKWKSTSQQPQAGSAPEGKASAGRIVYSAPLPPAGSVQKPGLSRRARKSG